MSLSQSRLHKLLHYDPLTGEFKNRITRGPRAIKGEKSGWVCDGYLIIQIDNKPYKAHRLVWLYVNGYFPETEIDHINRNRKDNRIDNIRVVSHTCNMRNKTISKNSVSEINGVTWCNKNMKWVSRISINSKLVYLGRYKSKLIAAMVRWSSEVCYKFPKCNSTSSAYLYLKERKLI